MKKKRSRYGTDRVKMVKIISDFANLSPGKKTSGYFTKRQLTELVAFITATREKQNA